MKTFQIKVSQYFSEKTKLGEVLHRVTQKEFKVLEDAAYKGAIWLQKDTKGKILKVRTLNEMVGPKDLVTFFYDQKVLSFPELKHAECLFENKHYGVWVKDAGVVPQGTQAGDHTSLLRFVEKQKKHDVYLVHRLDRETQGIMLIGYTSQAAAKLGDLFQKNLIQKVYQAIVLGEIPAGNKGTISDSLDGKEAITHYEVLDSREDRAFLKVTIETGRLHQIRRHLEGINHPVMGDPKYGRGNKNRTGLQLLAKSLSFEDPWEKTRRNFELKESLAL